MEVDHALYRGELREARIMSIRPLVASCPSIHVESALYQEIS